VLKDLAPLEGEVETKHGRWLMMRLRPYRTVEDRIAGGGQFHRHHRASPGRSEQRYRELLDMVQNAAVKRGANRKQLDETRERLKQMNDKK
jgi:two-component system CheB/CheR fusion protein